MMTSAEGVSSMMVIGDLVTAVAEESETLEDVEVTFNETEDFSKSESSLSLLS